MRLQARGLGEFEAMVQALESIHRHRQSSPTTPSDELYYELISHYNRRILNAGEAGRPLVGATVYVPNELLYAMDVVPMVMENVAVTFSIVRGAQEEMLNIAKGYGLTPEVCSNHRVMAALFLKGWAPPLDGVVWTHVLCDNTAKLGEAVAHLCRVPSFFLDRPYRDSPVGVDYLVGELQEMAAFLEGITGRPLDGDRLLEALSCSHRMVQLQQEIDGLRKRVPSPVSNRKIYQLLFVHWLYSGSPEGVRFYQAVRDELQEGSGPALPPERLRLLSLFVAPSYDWKILDWMEREHGARIVGDPYHCHWGPWEYDPSRPLWSLACKMLNTPACKQLHGPVGEFVADALQDAREFRADAAIYWAHTGCRQACGAIRILKDALCGAGLSTLVLDCDITDPTFVSAEELKDRMEAFFEVLEERR
jgi:benzoyl-CoA reductase/2-hydroxyglutaryl-CoA dehydratase subunit BcrC/BadD/HgdB